MSEGGFHVHGAHEHELEHAAQRGPGLAQQVAVFTAILATLGAFVSYQGGAAQNEAMMYKNEAVLKKAEASDQWAYYQSKSMKGHLAELAAHLTRDADKSAQYSKDVERYEKEKKEIRLKAEAFDEESKKANEKSEQIYHPHHRLAQAMTLIQISISLASITALTRKRWLFAAALVSAISGAALWAVSMVQLGF
jgi:hypothetical protein